MMNAIAPYWDGNETWLVLGGGGLLAAFPAAYAVLMPGLYLPIILMLLALILRGVSFEFRLRGRKHGKAFWTAGFAGGSLTAAFAQGLVLGGFIQGVKVRGGVFVGGAFDWLTPYTLLVACGVVAGYTLLGAGWLMLKTSDQLHGDARKWSAVSAAATAVLLLLVSLATLLVHPRVAFNWGFTPSGLHWPIFLHRLPIPLIGAAGLAMCGWGIWRRSHVLPFLGGLTVFLSGYLGLAAGLFPYVAPYAFTYEQAANDDTALRLMLWGVAILLPLILAYTAWVFWVFRGKVAADAGYH